MKTKKLCILIFALCFAAVTGAGFIVSQLYFPVSSHSHAVQEKVQIPMGTGTIKVAKLLKEKGLIRSEKFFVLAARVPFFYGRAKPYAIKSGIYNIDSSMTQASILELLDSGKQEYLKVVFPEGLTLGKIALMLEAEGVCPAADFREAATSYELLEKYQIPADSLEGYLFPDTYFFNPSMDAKAVVSMMADNFFDRIKTIQGLSEKSPSELYNILIMEEKQSIVALGAGTVTKRVFHEGDNYRMERCDNVKDIDLYIEKIDEMIKRKRILFSD